MTMKKEQGRLDLGNSQIETLNGSEAPSWSSNYRLLRSLYQRWEPTDELLREVWFRCYDKPHGMTADEVNHEDLRIAIVESRTVNKFNDPDFERIAEIYRRRRQERIIKTQARAIRSDADHDQQECSKEHEQRIKRISEWSEHRREAAMNRVRKMFKQYRKRDDQPTVEGWSQALSGLVVAADQEIQNAL